MNRRVFLAGTSAGGVLGLGGCLTGRFSLDSETPNGAEYPDERELPEPPESLEPADVREFVAEYEEAYTYNDLNNSSVTVSGTCENERAVVNIEAENGSYVTITDCRFNVSSTEGGNGAGTETTVPVLYLVTREEAVRIEPALEQHDEPYITEEQTLTDANGLWLTNFDDRAHNVSMTVTPQNDDGEPILDETYDIGAKSGRHVTYIAGIPGEYDVTATLGGESMTAVISSTEERPSTHPMGAVILPPDEELLVDVPEFDRN